MKIKRRVRNHLVSELAVADVGFEENALRPVILVIITRNWFKCFETAHPSVFVTNDLYFLSMELEYLNELVKAGMRL